MKDVSEKQFLRGCDKFLSLQLGAIVKAQLYLKLRSKNNEYTKYQKLFRLNSYYTSPLSYNFYQNRFYRIQMYAFKINSR